VLASQSARSQLFGKIEGALRDVVDDRFVPSIRRSWRVGQLRSIFDNNSWRDGGLEAHQGYGMMKCAVLSSSPCDGFSNFVN